VFVFEDRHHRLLTARSQTSQATYTHIYPEGTGPAGDFKMLRDSISYDHGRSNIVNSATFQVDVRAPGDRGAVWSTDAAVRGAGRDDHRGLRPVERPVLARSRPMRATTRSSGAPSRSASTGTRGSR
jgi:hypothetical protein